MATNPAAGHRDAFGAANLVAKIAAATGGSQDLGEEAVARLLAERGAEGIVVCGRNAANGERVAAETSAAGCFTGFVKADLAGVAQCRTVSAGTDRRFGRLDVLVNAAGLDDRSNIFDSNEERYDVIMDVNIRAPLFLIQEAVNTMRREKIEGSIVNIQSKSGPANHRWSREASQ